jgi:hypothetical protein
MSLRNSTKAALVWRGTVCSEHLAGLSIQRGKARERAVPVVVEVMPLGASEASFTTPIALAASVIVANFSTESPVTFTI